MKRLSLFMLIWVLTLFLPTISQAIQSKGIKVVIKDRSGREVGLYKGSHALDEYKEVDAKVRDHVKKNAERLHKQLEEMERKK